MAINDVYLLQVRYTIQQKECTINQGYRQSVGAAATDITRILIDAWRADVEPALLDVWTTEVQLQSIYALQVNPPGAIPAERSVVDTFGTAVGDTYPNDAPYVYSLITDSNSSKNNGRLFINGFSENEVSNQLLDPTFMSGEVQTLGDALVNDIANPVPATQEFAPVVINRVDDGVKITPPTSNDVIQIRATGIIYSQRRRRTVKTGTAA